MRKTVRIVLASAVVLVLLCTIVSVQAQTPDMGQGNANVIAQNMATSGKADVKASYYNQDGSLADDIVRTIRPLAAKEFLASATSIADPWIGSMILSSDEELASVVNLLWDGGRYTDGTTAASYAGPSQTSNVWYLPWVVVRPGSEAGQISVQNADSQEVKVTIQYYYRASSTPTDTKTDTIPVGGSRHYDLGSPGGKVPDLPGLIGKDSWSGSVVVQAKGGKQITIAYVNHKRRQSGAYVGATQLSQSLVGPMMVRHAIVDDGELKWLEWSSIILQNPNDLKAKVDVSFYSEQTGSVDKLFEDLIIGPHKVLILNVRGGGDVPAPELDPLDWDPTPDVYWRGWVVVESNRSICGVAQYLQRTRGYGMYEMIDPSQGSSALYMPAVYRQRSGGRWALRSRLWVANHSTNKASVDFYFYDRNGELDLSLTKAIPANEVKLLDISGSSFSSLGGDWVGSVYVSSNRSVGAIVDTFWGKPKRQSAYNAIGD